MYTAQSVVISVLDAIKCLDDALKNASTIVKYFRDAQLTKSHLSEDNDSEEGRNNLPLLQWTKKFSVNKF